MRKELGEREIWKGRKKGVKEGRKVEARDKDGVEIKKKVMIGRKGERKVV